MGEKRDAVPSSRFLIKHQTVGQHIVQSLPLFREGNHQALMPKREADNNLLRIRPLALPNVIFPPEPLVTFNLIASQGLLAWEKIQMPQNKANSKCNE